MKSIKLEMVLLLLKNTSNKVEKTSFSYQVFQFKSISRFSVSLT